MNYSEFENKIEEFKKRKLLSFDDVLEVIAPIIEQGCLLMDVLEGFDESSTELQLTMSVMNTAKNIGAELFDKFASRVDSSEINELGSYIINNDLM